MAKKGKRFTYLNAYEGNIIHAGIVFRLIHLQGEQLEQHHIKSSVSFQEYLRVI